MVWQLGWVDFDLGVPPSCPAGQPLLPNSHQPNQSQAVEHSKRKSTQLRPGADGTPCRPNSNNWIFSACSSCNGLANTLDGRSGRGGSSESSEEQRSHLGSPLGGRGPLPPGVRGPPPQGSQGGRGGMTPRRSQAGDLMQSMSLWSHKVHPDMQYTNKESSCSCKCDCECPGKGGGKGNSI